MAGGVDEGPVGGMRELLGFIESYYTGASGHDVASYADWFNLPTLIDASSLPGEIRSDELLVLHSADEIMAWREAMLEAYRDIGFGSLSARVLSVRLLTPKVAIFVGDVRRFRIDGSEINRSSHVYVLLRRDLRWRILATLPASDLDTTE